jgi:hypothetical protein
VIVQRHLCPYVDLTDERCAAVHTLINLKEAFRLCAGEHESCSVYHQIRLFEQRGGPDRLAAANLTRDESLTFIARSA